MVFRVELEHCIHGKLHYHKPSYLVSKGFICDIEMNGKSLPFTIADTTQKTATLPKAGSLPMKTPLRSYKQQLLWQKNTTKIQYACVHVMDFTNPYTTCGKSSTY